MTINVKDGDKKVEIISAVLLSIVIISTAWCAYQSTLWSGIMTFRLGEVNANTQKYVMSTIQQSQYSTVDVITFMEYINALNSNDEKRTQFFFERFREDFKPAVEAWLKTNPLENPDAPSHPLMMPEYKKTFSEDAEKFAEQSAIKLNEASQANKNSDNYILLTVIYASVLFLSGVLSKFPGLKVRTSLLTIGIIIYVITTIGLFSLPLAPELIID